MTQMVEVWIDRLKETTRRINPPALHPTLERRGLCFNFCKWCDALPL